MMGANLIFVSVNKGNKEKMVHFSEVELSSGYIQTDKKLKQVEHQNEHETGIFFLECIQVKATVCTLKVALP